jgi:hypothetical protein
MESNVVDGENGSTVFFYFAEKSNPAYVRVVTTEFDYQTDYQDEAIDGILEAMAEEHKPNLLLTWVIHPDPKDAEEDHDPPDPPISPRMKV